MLLENKIAVITGGGRGIGRAIAIHFAREGANVAIIARTADQLDRVEAEIKHLGRKARSVTADIADELQVAEAFAHIHDAFGRVDILVNNAGIEIKRPFAEMALDEWDRTMAVNARGVVLGIRAVLPSMIKRNAGNIINMASGAGLRGLPGSTAYSASKAAVIALTFSLADEVRDKGVRVNAICPGLIDTGMLAGSSLRKAESQVLRPEDVAGTAVFIASKLSGRVTGQVFSVRNSNRW
jgi:3-oxoacyl-[acyl-carrier protein] reductase